MNKENFQEQIYKKYRDLEKKGEDPIPFLIAEATSVNNNEIQYDLWSLIAVLSEVRKDFEQAEAALKKITEIFPDSAASWISLGRFYLQNNYGNDKIIDVLSYISDGRANQPQIYAYSEAAVVAIKINASELACNFISKLVQCIPEPDSISPNHELEILLKDFPCEQDLKNIYYAWLMKCPKGNARSDSTKPFFDE